MKNILFAWELGGGFGHVTAIRAIAVRLQALRYRISIASKDLSAAGKAFRGIDAQLFQSPHRLEPFQSDFAPALSYDHMLHNIGFGYPDTLYATTTAWQSIYKVVKPDAIIFDHSPTAMFASGATSIKKAVIGTGFTIPPRPLPLIRDLPDVDPDVLGEDAMRTIGIANTIGRELRLPKLMSLADIYDNVDASFLMTYGEMDHFGARLGFEYLGAREEGSGDAPRWPISEHPRVFAYFHRFAQAQEAIAQLTKLPVSALVYCPYLPVADAKRLNALATNIRFSAEPINISTVAQECQLAICHGGHGVVAQMLLAGVPVISIPLHQEQVLLSRQLTRNRLGVSIAPEDAKQLGQTVLDALNSNLLMQHAQQFSDKYATQTSSLHVDAIVRWVIESVRG